MAIVVVAVVVIGSDGAVHLAGVSDGDGAFGIVLTSVDDPQIKQLCLLMLNLDITFKFGTQK